MKTLILAGGIGSRMGGLVRDIPKPMIPINGKPILEHQVELLRRYGLKDIVLLTGYRADVIEGYFGRGEKLGVSISYRREDKPLGTAGAVKAMENVLCREGSFFVLYGDIILDIDLNAMLKFHKSKGASVTLAVHPNDHPYDSDLIEVDESGIVTAFLSKPHKPEISYRNLVNAGICIFNPDILPIIPAGSFFDFGKDILPVAVAGGMRIAVYNTTEYIKDVGTVERLREVERDIVSGKVARLNRKNKRKAIFIDRDGVLIEDRAIIKGPGDIKILDGAHDALRKINASEYLAIMVTNQPAVAKGYITVPELAGVHAALEARLGQKRAYLDRIYYCPHHPEKGFDGEIKELKIDCSCRKPKTGMITVAERELSIDLAGSWIIGDRTVDIMTGKNAGLSTVLVASGSMGKDGKYPCVADHVAPGINEAVDIILKRMRP